MARLRLIAAVRHRFGSEKARAEVDPIAQQHEREQQAGAAEDDDGAQRFDIDLETGGARKHSGKGGQCSLQQNPENSVSASITASAPYRCEAVHVSRIREAATPWGHGRQRHMINSGVCPTPHDDAVFDQWASEAVADFPLRPSAMRLVPHRAHWKEKKGHLRWQEAQSLGRKRP
jgi:hypothetical protein